MQMQMGLGISWSDIWTHGGLYMEVVFNKDHALSDKLSLSRWQLSIVYNIVALQISN